MSMTFFFSIFYFDNYVTINHTMSAAFRLAFRKLFHVGRPAGSRKKKIDNLHMDLYTVYTPAVWEHTNK